jgi:prepilin-type N-terminal cleavage/methylation domain-containing protein
MTRSQETDAKCFVAQRQQTGFTLLELLVVIAVIGILVALLFPAVNAALNKAKRVAASTEVKGIETAMKKYYQEYTGWPNTTPFGIPDAEPRALPVKGRVVTMLKGINENANNVKRLPFIDFTHTNNVGDPINPWGSKDPSKNTYKHYYYVKFDTDFDNMIRAGGGAAPDNLPRGSVPANVIVWTYNPKVPDSKPESVIGSWSR